MPITINELRAEHIKFGDMLTTYERQLLEPSLIVIPETKVHLYEGELYGGYLFDRNEWGAGHHVILLPEELEEADWDESIEWARSASGTLPSKLEWQGDLPSQPEQALLYANLPGEFQPEAYWSNEVSKTDSSCARYQYFDGGYQYGTLKSVQLRARRVRRFSASVI